MRISVALAAYKGERWIRDQLNSIATQSLLPGELIVTDDSPDDATARIAAEFARVAPFDVRICKNKRRLGFRSNFFKAVSLCSGDVIALCDQDDVWRKDKLKRMTVEFLNPDVMVAMHRVVVVDEQLSPLRVQSRNWYHKGIYAPLTTDPWYNPYGMSMLFRRELFTWIEASRAEIFTTRQMGHDTWIWFLAASLSCISAVTDKLALYRQHASNVNGTPAHEDVAQAIGSSTRTGRTRYEFLASTARARANTLDSIASYNPPAIIRQAKEAAAYYTRLSDYYRRRASLYSAAPREQKWRAIRALWHSGAYRGLDNGGIGGKAAVKDTLLALVRNQVID